MSTFEHRTRISRDPEEVWGVVGDFDNDARWRRVDVMTSDPEGPVRLLEPLLTHLYDPRISTELQTLKQLLEHER